MMKTTARFTVSHGPLTADQYQKMNEFARLVPADTCFHDSGPCPRKDITLHLDVEFEIGTDPPWPRPHSQISTSLHILVADLVRWFADYPIVNMYKRIASYRSELMENIGEYIRVQVEKAAPPMPPEPEPVYVETGIRICGQKLAFESTRTDKYDQDIQRTLKRTWETFVQQVLNRTD